MVATDRQHEQSGGRRRDDRARLESKVRAAASLAAHFGSFGRWSRETGREEQAQRFEQAAQQHAAEGMSIARQIMGVPS